MRDGRFGHSSAQDGSGSARNSRGAYRRRLEIPGKAKLGELPVDYSIYFSKFFPQFRGRPLLMNFEQNLGVLLQNLGWVEIGDMAT